MVHLSRRHVIVATSATIFGYSGCIGRGSDGSNNNNQNKTELQYSELDPESKKLFRQIMDEKVKIPSNEIPLQLSEEPIVVYDDNKYSIIKEDTDENISNTTYQIKREQPDDIGEENNAIKYSQLSPSEKSRFDKLVDNENQEVAKSPAPVEYDYIQYNEEYYKISATTSDIRVWKLYAKEETGLF